MSTLEQHDPKAAPGALDLIRQFVNTLDIEDQQEELSDPAALASWLSERDLLAPEETLDDADVAHAQDVREALRKLLLANNGDELDPGAVDSLNAASQRAALVVAFDATGAADLAPARQGIDGAVGRLLAIAFRAMAEGTWARLKACPDHDCEWAFYDHSKNRSAMWCSMRVCGNRAKARAYRERRPGGGRR